MGKIVYEVSDVGDNLKQIKSIFQSFQLVMILSENMGHGVLTLIAIIVKSRPPLANENRK